MAAKADHCDGFKVATTVRLSVLVAELGAGIFAWLRSLEAELHVNMVGIFGIDAPQQFLLVLGKESEVFLVRLADGLEGLEGGRGTKPAVQFHTRPEPELRLDTQRDIHPVNTELRVGMMGQVGKERETEKKSTTTQMTA